jgi:hypothetical protein
MLCVLEKLLEKRLVDWKNYYNSFGSVGKTVEPTVGLLKKPVGTIWCVEKA